MIDRKVELRYIPLNPTSATFNLTSYSHFYTNYSTYHHTTSFFILTLYLSPTSCLPTYHFPPSYSSPSASSPLPSSSTTDPPSLEDSSSETRC